MYFAFTHFTLCVSEFYWVDMAITGKLDFGILAANEHPREGENEKDTDVCVSSSVGHLIITVPIFVPPERVLLPAMGAFTFGDFFLNPQLLFYL